MVLLPKGTGHNQRMSMKEDSAAADDVLPVVRTFGELDVDNLEPLQKRLEQAADTSPGVVLDAGDITFGDSSFLRVLLAVNQRTDLRIAAPRPVLQQLFSLVGMDRVLKVSPSVAEAQAAPLVRTAIT